MSSFLSFHAYAAPDNLKTETQISFIKRYFLMVKSLFSVDEGGEVFDPTRRAFMQKSLMTTAGAGLLSAEGGTRVIDSIFHQIREKVSPEALRRLAKLRNGRSSNILLDRAGLESYKRALLNELSQTADESLKLVIKERLNQMEQAVLNTDLMESIEDDRKDFGNFLNIFSDPVQLDRYERRTQKARERLIESGKLQSLEVLVITARNLLDSVLLKRISHQINLYRFK